MTRIEPGLDVRAHRAPLRAIALALSRDATEAEQLVQDTFQRAVFHLGGGGEQPRNPRSWLISILRGAFIDQLRRTRELPRPIDDVVVPAVGARSPWAELTLLQLRAAFAQLEPELRRAFRLRYLEGKRYRTMATELSLPAHAVADRVWCAGRALRAMLLPATASGTEANAVGAPPATTPAALQALADGELTGDDAERTRLAVATAPALAAALEDCLQLAVVGEALRDGAGDRLVWPEEPPSPFARRALWRAATAAALAAALIAVYTVVAARARQPSVEAELAGALAPRRELAARLSWPAADAFRPYDPERTDQAQAERLPFSLLGRVEALDDPRALVAAHILTGNLALAAALLQTAPTADLESDRAALALARGDGATALIAARAALALAPTHEQAGWNYGLALAQLGLSRAAAAALARARAPGWATEGRARAASLRSAAAGRDADHAAALAAGEALIAGRSADGAALVASAGLAQRLLRDALLSADSAQRLDALAPLVAAVDRDAGGALRAALARAKAAPIDARGPLARRYAALVAGALGAAEAQRLIADARAAGDTDLALGALAYAARTPGALSGGALADLTALADATADPWLELVAASVNAREHRGRGDLGGAESILRAAAERWCRGGAVPYRCPRIDRDLAELYLALHRPEVAAAALERARTAALADGDRELEPELLWLAHTVERARADAGDDRGALADAYLEEWSLTKPDCAARERARESAAMALVEHHQVDRARALYAARAPGCESPFTVGRALTLAHLLPAAESSPRVAAVRAAIDQLRARALDASERARLDGAEGRLLSATEPNAAHALLRRAIAGAGKPGADDVEAREARADSYAVLAREAGLRGDYAGMLALLAEERQLSAPARCALGAAADETAAFAIADIDGRVRGVTIAAGAGPPPAPANLISALAGCPTIDVLARPPYYGRAALLSPALSWRYRTGPTSPPAGAPARPGRAVVIAAPAPPASLALAPLPPLAPDHDAVVEQLVGAAATPDAVLAALADAGYVEIYAYAVAGRAGGELAYLALSPDATGRYALTAGELARAVLRGRPVVVLAAGHVDPPQPTALTPWSLADALRSAGARAVIASPTPIVDPAAPAFFDRVRERVAAGASATEALSGAREAWPHTEASAWVDALVAFE